MYRQGWFSMSAEDSIHSKIHGSQCVLGAWLSLGIHNQCSPEVPMAGSPVSVYLHGQL